MLNRRLKNEIEQGLATFPAVALYGSRQVGKSTLAREIASGRPSFFIDLENPRHEIMLQDPLTVFEGHSHELIVIDEAQRKPELFPTLRVLIDQDRHPGRFLLLGSASPTLSRQESESLAGRIQSFELHPFDLCEIQRSQMDKLWIKGGFPLSFLAEDESSSMIWRQEYIRNLIERDMRILGFDLDPRRIRTFLVMLAHNHGQIWNASQLAKSMGISTSTAIRYLSAMEQLFLVRRVAPYYANIGKRLRKSPKIYLSDSGIMHAMLNLPDKISLLEHPVCGFSWEGFVLQQLTALLPNYGLEISFWQTSSGAEIDFLILKNNIPTVAIEVKMNATNPRPCRGFFEGCKDLNLSERWVIYPGTENFLLTNDIQVMSLPTALDKLKKQ
jgi:uncharacterized protein